MVMDHLYGVSSKIIHVTKGSDLHHHVPSLIEHFNKYGSPLMMGGDKDCSAKAVVGVHASGSDAYFLIVVRLYHVLHIVYILLRSVICLCLFNPYPWNKAAGSKHI
jgi:hypothetical protein